MYPASTKGDRPEEPIREGSTNEAESNAAKQMKVEQPKLTGFPLDHILPVFNIGNDQSKQNVFPGAMKKNKQAQLPKTNFPKGHTLKTLEGERQSLVGPSPLKTTTIGHTPTPITTSKITIGHTPHQSSAKANIAGMPCTSL